MKKKEEVKQNHFNVTLSTTDGTNITTFKAVTLDKFITYLKRKFESNLNKNIDEGTAIKGNHKNSKRPPKKNDKL